MFAGIGLCSSTSAQWPRALTIQVTDRSPGCGDVRRKEVRHERARPLPCPVAQEQPQQRQRPVRRGSHLDQAVAVRDSKNPDGPKLFFTRHDWTTFIHRLKSDPYPASPGKPPL